MRVEEFINIIDSDFYTGVPDSQLKALCNYLMNAYGTDSKHHVIAANEGNAVGIAAGYHLATGKVPVVYLQNSGEGNIINPLASLMNEKVYGIPCILVIGWRGEPGESDEPQHIYQGEITLKLLSLMGVEHFVLGSDTTEEDVKSVMQEFRKKLDAGLDVAFVIKKGGLCYSEKISYRNNFRLTREEVIRQIVSVSGDDPIICTTGKASRELFEIREENGQGHEHDFLTVGSMGHASSIALGIAIQEPRIKVWCIDGDGAALMHMGAMAIIARMKAINFVHILINNGAHESVGGILTAARSMNLSNIAKYCGYPHSFCVSDPYMLKNNLNIIRGLSELCYIEIKCSLYSKKNLGRPQNKPIEIKKEFMDGLHKN